MESEAKRTKLQNPHKQEEAKTDSLSDRSPVAQVFDEQIFWRLGDRFQAVHEITHVVLLP